MRTKEFLQEMATNALGAVKADQIEVGIRSENTDVTRFANSMIHQNISKETDELWARVILGKKIGGTSVTSLTKERVAKGMESAHGLAEHQKEDPEFKSLPKAKSVEHVEKVRDVDPDERSACVEKIISVAKRNSLTAAGAIYTGRTSLHIRNSLGVDSFGTIGSSSAEVTLMSDDSSGYAGEYAKDFSEIDCETLANIASEKALLSKNPVEVPPGKYTVFLEPQAVAEFLMYLFYIGFGARAYQEGSSFMSGKIGKKITGDNITLVDDVSRHDISRFHFDAEGVPTEKITLIESGIARNIVYDSYYAGKEGKESTGHAMPQPNPYGPFPKSVIVPPGDSTREDMLQSIDKGLLLTRFWYTRLIDPDATLVTGMTRDGTFLIENGKVTKGIKNLRYTANILDTLKNVVGMSQNTKLIWGAASVPSMVIENFNFSGKTEY